MINFIPLVGSVLEAVGMIAEKQILALKNITYKNYTVFSFFGIVILSLLGAHWFWHVYPGAFSAHSLLLLLCVIVFSVIANILTYYSLQKENVSEFEPLWLMQNFFVIIFAIIFYNNERNWVTVALALVASIALIVSHVRKDHFAFTKYNFAVLIAGLLFSIELAISKPLLAYYSPFSLYFIRGFFIFAVALAIYRPSFNTPNAKTWASIFLLSLAWIIYRIILYSAYGSLGIVYTTSLVIISPVLMLLIAISVLKEKPTLRQIICNGIIVARVAASVFFS